MKKGWISLGVLIVALLLLIFAVYKVLGGPLGNAFIVTIVILAIILGLVEIFRDRFLKIARKILKKEDKGGPDGGP